MIVMSFKFEGQRKIEHCLATSKILKIGTKTLLKYRRLILPKTSELQKLELILQKLEACWKTKLAQK